MSIMIGHASSDERGKYNGGQAGDQNGREVYVREWYNRPWNKVVRPKSAYVAAGMVRAMRDACHNNSVGYDQSQRTTLYTQAKAAGWDLSKITVPCETDCSALIAVCANAAGVAVSKDIYTGNMVKVLEATGQFEVLAASKYLTSDAYLMAGAVQIYEGHHTAMALQYGTKTNYRQGWNYDYYGWFYSQGGGRDYLRSYWQVINHHKYYFNTDGYALKGWQMIGGKDYYFEPRAGHPLECAMYVAPEGEQHIGEF